VPERSASARTHRYEPGPSPADGSADAVRRWAEGVRAAVAAASGEERAVWGGQLDALLVAGVQRHDRAGLAAVLGAAHALGRADTALARSGAVLLTAGWCVPGTSHGAPQGRVPGGTDRTSGGT